ncbi:Glutathione S-transferase, N-terminal domain [Popillia japonica]|uniref:Glutathione S-transferase, N-terminal domain n=1 Tax=Popillia japonica TaxID=7064 RepID=A0AAW1JZA8_POPJA
MVGLKLYYDLVSQPSRALFILLTHYKVPFQPVLTNIAKGENKTEEFKKISPFQKLPAAEDDGFPMIESVAILRYLARTKKLPDSFYPQDVKPQFKVDEFLEWHHQNIRLPLSMYFFQKWLIPNRLKLQPNEKAVANAKKDMEAALDGFEKVWLARGPFITGNDVTAADLWAACEIEQPRICGYNARVGRPNLTAWIERVKEHYNPVYDKTHGPLYKLEQLGKK